MTPESAFVIQGTGVYISMALGALTRALSETTSHESDLPRSPHMILVSWRPNTSLVLSRTKLMTQCAGGVGGGT